MVSVQGNSFLTVDGDLGPENSKAFEILKCFSANSLQCGYGWNHPNNFWIRTDEKWCLPSKHLKARAQPREQCLDTVSPRVFHRTHRTVVGLFYFLRFYLFFHERPRERGRDTGRGRSRLPVGCPMWDSIPGPQGHDLSLRQTPSQLNYPGTPKTSSFLQQANFEIC